MNVPLYGVLSDGSLFFDFSDFISFLLSIWWFFTVLLIVPFGMKFWLVWRRYLWEKNEGYTFIEIIPPKNVPQPFQAMEHVYEQISTIHTSLTGMRDIPKRWWHGKQQAFFTVEIVATGGRIRFLIRCSKKHTDTIKVALQSQFANLGIAEDVPDYLKLVSWATPNAEWDLYGLDFSLSRPDVYPIKTYTSFEPRPDIVEEKRIDPLSTLLAGLATMGDDEYLFFQMRCAPVTGKETDFYQRSKKVISKLAFRRSEKPARGEREVVPSEMKLTGRERDVVAEIQRKASKSLFHTNIRLLYMARRSLFRENRIGLAEQFLATFSAQDLNSFRKFRKTRTKVYYYHILYQRFLYVKKRQFLRRYILREVPLYPMAGSTYILNTEELATLFHIPLALATTGIPVETIASKVGAPPLNLLTKRGDLLDEDNDTPSARLADQPRLTGASGREEGDNNTHTQ